MGAQYAGRARCGFNAAPTRTWLWNRTNSGSCAVNADAVVMVAGLTRLALEGKIAKKFNPQNTAEKVLIFFHDELGCDIPAIDHRIFEPNNRHDTAVCLSACVESLFSSLVDKSRKSKRALRKAVENRLSSLPWKEERGQQGISVVRNRAREYAEAFAEPLHLEDDLEDKASLQKRLCHTACTRPIRILQLLSDSRLVRRACKIL